MPKFTATSLNSGFDTVTSLNNNFSALETFSDTCLTTDGTSPNAMAADIDMNSNKVINVATPTVAGDAATKSYVDSAVAGEIVVAPQPIPEFIVLRNEQAQNTAALDVAATWTAVAFNTTEDPSSIVVSTTSTQFTLPIGTYKFDLRLVALGAVGTIQARLWDDTDSSVAISGPAAEVDATTTTSFGLVGTYTTTVQSTFEIQVIGDAAVSNALGVQGNLGPEVFLELDITSIPA